MRLIFSIYLILLALLASGFNSVSNRNEYQKQENNVSGEQSAASSQGWQPYRHLCADCLDNVGSLTAYNPIGLHGLLQGWLHFFYFLSKSVCLYVCLPVDFYAVCVVSRIGIE
jgi:hypothetical protein